MNTVKDDYALIQECLSGSPRAFEEIVSRYYTTVFNVASRILNNQEDASDVTQSVFLNVYEHLGDFSPRHRFFSWIYRITVNASLNALRTRRPCESPEELVTDTKNPEEILHDAQTSEIIGRALGEIKIEYRVVIILNHFQELNYHEMAYVLDVPEKTVKSRLFTARRLLRDILVRENNL
jgi:RNA polymerase sigma-70 factor, ECF subfamily